METILGLIIMLFGATFLWLESNRKIKPTVNNLRIWCFRILFVTGAGLTAYGMIGLINHGPRM